MNTSITAFAPMWIRCSAWPALQAATAPLVVALLVGSLLIGPNGIEIKDLGFLAEANSKFSAGVLLLWSLAMGPAASAALRSPGLRYLRWLPIPTWFVIGHLALVLIFLQLPYALLILVAGKPALAGCLLGAGVGLNTCLLLPSFKRWQSLLHLALGVGILSLLAFRQPALAGAAGVLASLLLLPSQYRQAAQPSRRHMRRALFGGATLSLLLIQLLRLRRNESVSLMRALWVASAGAALLVMVSRANAGLAAADAILVSLVAATPCFAAVATIMAIALRRGQEEIDWLRLSLGISTPRLRASTLLLLGLVMVAVATLVAFVALHTLAWGPAESLRLLASLIAHGFFWSCVASTLSYRAMRAGGDQSPAMLALLIALGDMVLVGFVGPWSLLVEFAILLLLLSRILAFASDRGSVQQGAIQRGIPRA